MSSRRSIKLSCTKVSRTVLVLGAVGRSGLPQPSREVSIRKPRVDGKPPPATVEPSTNVYEEVVGVVKAAVKFKA